MIPRRLYRLRHDLFGHPFVQGIQPSSSPLGDITLSATCQSRCHQYRQESHPSGRQAFHCQSDRQHLPTTYYLCHLLGFNLIGSVIAASAQMLLGLSRGDVSHCSGKERLGPLERYRRRQVLH